VNEDMPQRIEGIEMRKFGPLFSFVDLNAPELLDGVNLVFTLPQLRQEVLHRLLEFRRGQKNLINVTKHLHNLRVVKSPNEIELMRRSGAINAASFIEVHRNIANLSHIYSFR